MATTPTHTEIRALPTQLVNQIAAGEVVERPASVVKELLDNAIDAGASRVTIELRAGGIELIRVTDDGNGIPDSQLAMALAPHATSKISSLDDLERIQTMGFRGEALASIASVSRLSIRSRTPSDDSAHILEIESDQNAQPRPTSGPVGTTVTVRNLFYNTPARRKFLRTPTTEQTHCAQIVRNLAAAHAHIGFTLIADDKTKLDYPPSQPLRQRASAIMGKELEAQLLEVTADELDDARGLSLWGLVGLPDIARPTTKGQRFFVNGRPIRDSTIQHALQEAYRGLIEPSRKPSAILLIEMTPQGVDVNVHPTKSQVRFRDSGLVHKTIYRAVREALQREDLTPTLRLPTHTQAQFASGLTESKPSNATISAGAFVEMFKRLQPETAQQLLRAEPDQLPVSAPEPSRVLQPPEPVPQHEHDASLLAPRKQEHVLQVHNSYLVTQDDSGVVIIDQHALHERVMFERLLERVSQGPLEQQRLLTPIMLEASEAQIDLLPRFEHLFETIAIDAQPAGAHTIAIHAFPTILLDKRVEPEPFLADLLEKAESDNSFDPDTEDALRDVLDMMSCKAAIKAGDKLSDSELASLLEQRDMVDRSSNCPHGRPTTLRLTIAQLEHLFGRT
ncbi:MAG: DNA mismatch repair endonuclease MutL [Planctomycetota bacterium]|jgi:DNA mismatch repair protein MutL